MTERLTVSVFDEEELHRLRAAGFQEVEIVRDEARHEFFILERMTTTNEFARTVGKKIGPLGAAFMMHGETGQYGESIGLGFLEFYALGRGGVLGNVEPDVVVDAFGFFEPTLVANTWNAARQKMDPKQASEHYRDACAEWGRKRLAAIDSLERFNEIAERVIAANTAPGALFDGWKQVSLPDDAPGRAMVLIHVLREMRGGAHIEAVRRVGIPIREALATNAPHMYQIFGWTDEMPAPDPERAGQAEDITDELVAPAFEGLDESEREIFADVIDAAAAAGS
jgi:hypothetical protein